MTVTMPYVCIACGDVLCRDGAGLYCEKCYPAHKQRVFRAVVTMRINDLTASADSVPEKPSKRLDIDPAMRRAT